MDLSSGSTGLIIFYAIFIFFGLVILITGIIMIILHRRKKLTFCNFLNKTSQWEKESYMPDEIDKIFQYDKCTYEFNIRKCTRDKLNRPIAHYYKGNPKQQEFNIDDKNRDIVIGTEELTQEDFMTLMKTKVLKDIFTDDEVMNLLMVLLIVMIVGFVAVLIIIFAHNPAVKLSGDNETLQIIANGVKLAIKSG